MRHTLGEYLMESMLKGKTPNNGVPCPVVDGVVEIPFDGLLLESFSDHTPMNTYFTFKGKCISLVNVIATQTELATREGVTQISLKNFEGILRLPISQSRFKL